MCETPEGPVTSNIRVESGCTITNPVIDQTTLPRVTLRVPLSAFPWLSTATRYWPGNVRPGVPNPVSAKGMFATTNGDLLTSEQHATDAISAVIMVAELSSPRTWESSESQKASRSVSWAWNPHGCRTRTVGTHSIDQ